MFIISLLAAAAAASAPTYLRCSFDGEKDMLVTADEANSAVTVSKPTGDYIEKLPAAFTTDEVRFRNRIVTWSINRVDLSAQQTLDGGATDHSGKCRLEAAPKRAF